MSSSAPPDHLPIAELERLVDALEHELSAWRDRALRAEQEATPVKGRGHGPELSQARQRIGLLEGENRALTLRIAAAREQVEQLKSRLRFVEEHEAEGAA